MELVKQNETLIKASARGRLQTVKDALEKGAELESRNIFNCTALMEACKSGTLNVVQHLAEQGADLEAKNDNGLTGLVFAALSNNVRVVRFLLNEGVNVNAAGGFITESAISAACLHGNGDLVKSLVEGYGADINSKDIFCGIIRAISLKNRVEILRYLVEQGLNLEDRTNTSLAFVTACNVGSLPVLKFLVEEIGMSTTGSDSNFLAYGKKLAARAGHENVMAYLETLSRQKVTPIMPAHVFDAATTITPERKHMAS